MGVCAYLLQRAGQRMKNFSVWNQLLAVAVLALFYQLVSIVVSLIAGKGADNWFMLYPVLSSLVLWPLLAITLWWLYRAE
jgi:rod shape-determining protein MreD